MLPNFIVIGAAKCGTTSICEVLGRHPRVFMSDPKEPCYFSHMDETRTRAWYESLFASVSVESAIGEGSTAYTHPDVIEVTASRIQGAIPDCRLIYMVRHPIARLESDWRMRRHEGWTPTSISEAVLQQSSLIGHSLYWENLSVYRRYFPDDQIHIVFLEDFAADPDRELARCFLHIGVDPTITVDDASRPRNRAADFRQDSPIAARLRRSKYFESFKAALPSKLVGMAKQALTRQEEFTANWEPKARQKVVEAIAGDAASFLAHCGRPSDLWDLSVE